MDRTRFNRPPRTRSCIARAPSDPAHAPGDWDRLQARFNPLHADLKPFPSGGGRGAGELQGDLKSVEAGLKRAKRTAPRGDGGIDAKERDTSREYPFSRLVIGRWVVGGHDAGREGREGRKGREGVRDVRAVPFVPFVAFVPLVLIHDPIRPVRPVTGRGGS